jgi:hypothetical protein
VTTASHFYALDSPWTRSVRFFLVNGAFEVAGNEAVMNNCLNGCRGRGLRSRPPGLPWSLSF